MTDDTLAYLAELVEECHRAGLQVLVEVHSHYTHQLRLAELVDLVYDFATGPCLLHATYTGDTAPLAAWLEQRPANNISILDTHDGIGIVDARGVDGLPGLITDQQAADIFAVANELTGGLSSRASVIPQFNVIPHQINATYLGVLGNDEESLLALRVAQLMLPGPAHVYYAGALGLGDDEALWRATGEGRSVNRPVLAAATLVERAQSLFVRANRALVRLATTHPAFEGEYTWSVEGGVFEQAWVSEGASCRSRVLLGGRRARFELFVQDGDAVRSALSVEELARWLT